VIRRLLVLVSCTPFIAIAQATAPTPPPEIFFRAPANGATVTATFPVVFGLRNYGVAPAGANISGTGHFHILVDVEAPPPGTVIPQDSLNLHFGKAVIETRITLSPGKHTLRLVLGDFEHKVIGPALVSAPITITVRK
jgi:hypothetical protein